MPGESDAPGIGDRLNIVPVGLSSSSDKGLSEVLTSGASEELTTGDQYMERGETMEREEREIKNSTFKEDSERTDEQMEIEKEALKRKRLLDTDEEDEFNVQSANLSARKQRIMEDNTPPERVEGPEGSVVRSQDTLIISISEKDATDYRPVASLHEEGADLGEEEDRAKRKEVKKGRGRPKKMERKIIGVPDLDAHELSDSSDNEGLNATPAEAGARVLEYLENIEEIRKKSKNIKGDLSGIIKKRLKDSKVIVRALMRKADKEIGKEKEQETEKDRDWEIKLLKMTNK